MLCLGNDKSLHISNAFFIMYSNLIKVTNKVYNIDHTYNDCLAPTCSVSTTHTQTLLAHQMRALDILKLFHYINNMCFCAIICAQVHNEDTNLNKQRSDVP